jgi:hypothetical protein
MITIGFEKMKFYQESAFRFLIESPVSRMSVFVFILTKNDIYQ